MGEGEEESIIQETSDVNPINPPEENENSQNNKGLNGKLAFAIASCAFGSAFQHGFNIGVVNAPQHVISQFINETHYERTSEYMTKEQVNFLWSVTVSIFAIGGIFGGLSTGVVADKVGRKYGLLCNNFFVFIAVILEGFSKSAKSYEMLIAGRLFIGFNCGLNAGLAPLYLNEISPIHLRGAVGTVYQLVVTIAILLSQILGYVLGTKESWPFLFTVIILPAAFQICTLSACPESPKFTLLNQGKEIEAQNCLRWLRNTIEVHDELDEMKAEHESNKLVPKVTLKDMFIQPGLRTPLIIACMMMMAQQFSGINAAIYFSTDLFMSAGLTEQKSQYATIGMGICNVLMTLFSLILVEKLGRKTLMMIGLTGMFFDAILLFFSLLLKDSITWIPYVSIFLVIIFVCFFATGPGSIPWFLVTEMFSQNSRSMASSLAVAVNWIANFIVSLLFLPVKDWIGPYIFLIFAGSLAGFLTFTWKKVPETKNKTVEEITSNFRREGYQN